jgi:hypothetical protein
LDDRALVTRVFLGAATLAARGARLAGFFLVLPALVSAEAFKSDSSIVWEK